MAKSDIGEYLQLRIDEASARLRAVAQVVSQSTSKGNTGEDVLRDIIASFLPVRFEVSNGFIISQDTAGETESKQIDILVYERNDSVPLYRDRTLAVVTSDMPRMALESKMTMNKSQLKEAIANIQSVKALRPKTTCVIWAYGGMTLKTLKTHLSTLLSSISYDEWPDQVFNLQRGYVVSRKKKKPNGPVWTAFHGKKFVAKSLLQTVLFSAEVDNLTQFISGIKAEKTEQF